MSARDLYGGDYNIETPESVAFDFEIADLGNRFLAALIDTIILTFALLGINAIAYFLLRMVAPGYVMGYLDDGSAGWAGGLVIALYAILNFFTFWGYYILQEVRWNGQTLGKRAMRIRVVRVDGGPAGAAEIIIRNLLRIIDLLPTAYLAGFISIVANRQARRLGDYAAGTLVVKAGGRITLESVVATYGTVAPLTEATAGQAAPRSEDTLALDLDTRRLRPADAALIGDLLQRTATQKLDPAFLTRLAGVIASKLDHPQPSGDDARAFLERVARAYRRQE